MARIVINLRAVSEFRMQRLLNCDSEALRMISRNPASVRPKPASSPGGPDPRHFFSKGKHCPCLPRPYWFIRAVLLASRR